MNLDPLPRSMEDVGERGSDIDGVRGKPINLDPLPQSMEDVGER
jgi:hypothetical protein